MSKKQSYLKILFVIVILLLIIFTGCIENQKGSDISDNESKYEILSDLPSILPEWEDGKYHGYYETMELLNDFNLRFPDLVEIFRIGRSVLGKDIFCFKISNEKNRNEKYTVLIDGCIHGSEWESGEACLYISEYLLINFGSNKTITDILNKTIVYVVPLMNPDGRDNDYRYNENGIDLNRNFDIDFGRLRGHCIPLGKILGRKIPYLTFQRLNIWFTNCGRRPFSEPESQAIRDLMRFLDSQKFSFYINCHTATHSINTPWSSFKPPFEINQQESKVYDEVRKWISENSEYEDKKLWYRASGTAPDWCYKIFHVPSFTFEILSMDYEPGSSGGRHDNLVHWMKTTIPVFMFLFVNVESLYNWKVPDIEPPLPKGIPPDPLR